MVRSSMVMVALLVLAGATSARGQDTDDVKRLKEKVELLQAKLEAATLKIEKLQAELDQARKGGAKPSGGEAKSLSELLTSDVVIQGDVMFTTGGKASGDWSLKITERDGKKFKGTYTVRLTRPQRGDELVYDVEGNIDGNLIKFSTKNSAKVNGTFSGELKK